MDKIELKFLGYGDAFTPEFGNTAAYFIEEKTLYLLDCGELVFAKLKKLKLLDEIDRVVIFITHTHSDHIGSLGSLIHYLYCMCDIVPVVVLHDKDNDIEKYLEVLGVIQEAELKTASEITSELVRKVEYLPSKHSSHVHASSLLFHTTNGTIFYSGDIADDDYQDIADIVNVGGIYALYVDATDEQKSLSSPHMSVERLAEIIPPELYKRTWLMHFNDRNNALSLAKKLGFRTVDKIVVNKAEK